MSNDALLLIGEGDPKLPKLLNKLGYKVLSGPDAKHVSEALRTNLVDLIIVDSRVDLDLVETCRYFKSDSATREVPIVVLAKDRLDALHVKEESFSEIECLVQPASVGAIVGKVATQLRLRKMTGAENPYASLAVVNAALRDNNEVFRKEREQARNIQQSLLPTELPKSSHYDMAIKHQPLEEVGGDWYFFQQIPGGKTAFQILDVTGHGLSAALIGSMTRLAIAAVHRVDPEALLAEVNRLLTPHLPEGRFVTMLASVYEETTGKLSFARAGHPPALVLSRKASKVTELKPPGFAVGFIDDGRFPQVGATLEKDDVVVFLTDGISEAQDRGNKYFGFDGISKAMLESAPDWTAEQILQHIVKSCDKFTDGRRLKDDVTLLVLVRR